MVIEVYVDSIDVDHKNIRTTVVASNASTKTGDERHVAIEFDLASDEISKCYAGKRYTITMDTAE